MCVCGGVCVCVCFSEPVVSVCVCVCVCVCFSEPVMCVCRIFLCVSLTGFKVSSSSGSMCIISANKLTNSSASVCR